MKFEQNRNKKCLLPKLLSLVEHAVIKQTEVWKCQLWYLGRSRGNRKLEYFEMCIQFVSFLFLQLWLWQLYYACMCKNRDLNLNVFEREREREQKEYICLSFCILLVDSYCFITGQSFSIIKLKWDIWPIIVMSIGNK